jgi:uncharacterized protein (DUF885 family)
MNNKNKLGNFGLACSYKIGMLKILELRQKAKEQLGDKFDLQDFHNAVFQKGEVHINILEDITEDYIKLKKQ